MNLVEPADATFFGGDADVKQFVNELLSDEVGEDAGCLHLTGELCDEILAACDDRFLDGISDEVEKAKLPKCDKCCKKGCIHGLAFFETNMIREMHQELKHLRNEIDNPSTQVKIDFRGSLAFCIIN